MEIMEMDMDMDMEGEESPLPSMFGGSPSSPSLSSSEQRARTLGQGRFRDGYRGRGGVASSSSSSSAATAAGMHRSSRSQDGFRDREGVGDGGDYGRDSSGEGEGRGGRGQGRRDQWGGNGDDDDGDEEDGDNEEDQEEKEGEEEQQRKWSDLDSDDIRSLDSEELHEMRPNRWTGSSSTWRRYTRNERLLAESLDQARRGDLTGHLFNAFALRKRGGMGDGEAGRPKWWPSKSWTAWPLRARQVPHDGLMAETNNDDGLEEFTTRMPPPALPSAHLEHQISATVLRFAKERVRTRLQRGEFSPPSGAVDSVEIEEDSEEDSEDGMGRENQGESVREEQGAEEEQEKKEEGGGVEVLADDEYSYSLLRPTARQILAKLDDTLAVLHNARMACLDVGDSEDEEGTENREDTEAETKHRRPGPRKHHELQYGSRIRVSHSKSGARSRSKSQTRSPSPARLKPQHVRKWKTRDWRDVMGAAAFAGFSPAVIARATQRCSTLFGQEMTIHTLPEQAASEDTGAMQTERYVPETVFVPSSDEEEDGDEAMRHVEQLRAVNRPSTVRLSTPTSSEDETGAPAKKKRRKTSAATTAALSQSQHFFCTHATCPRAMAGFPRPQQLAVHLRGVHGASAEEIASATNAAEEDSMDEMDGAVHTDGFLRPIKARKGWRGDDRASSAKRKGPRGSYISDGNSRSRSQSRASRTPRPAAAESEGVVDTDARGSETEELSA